MVDIADDRAHLKHDLSAVDHHQFLGRNIDENVPVLEMGRQPSPPVSPSSYSRAIPAIR